MSCPFDPNEIVLVCAADNNYAMPMAVTIRSVVDNLRSDRRIVLYLVDGGIEEKHKRLLLRSWPTNALDIRWVRPDTERFEKARVSRHITMAAYYRILIPEFVSDEYEKAIYLDSDLIVLHDLGQLWAVNVDDHHLLAVQDMCVPYVSSPTGLELWREFGLSADVKYFNSGVLVYNLRKWREDGIAEKVVDYLTRYQQYVHWHDQDGLNAVLASKWGELDPRWNHQTPHIQTYTSWQDSPFDEATYLATLNAPYLIHFVSRFHKPWRCRTRCLQRDLFLSYLKRTAWSGWHTPFFASPLWNGWLATEKAAKRLAANLGWRAGAGPVLRAASTGGQTP